MEESFETCCKLDVRVPMAAYTFDVLLNKTISDKWAENEGLSGI